MARASPLSSSSSSFTEDSCTICRENPQLANNNPQQTLVLSFACFDALLEETQSLQARLVSVSTTRDLLLKQIETAAVSRSQLVSYEQAIVCCLVGGTQSKPSHPDVPRHMNHNSASSTTTSRMVMRSSESAQPGLYQTIIAKRRIYKSAAAIAKTDRQAGHLGHRMFTTLLKLRREKNNLQNQYDHLNRDLSTLRVEVTMVRAQMRVLGRIVDQTLDGIESLGLDALGISDGSNEDGSCTS